MNPLALVVGIERYGLGPGTDLPGAAAEAERFARWAISAGVPAGRVLLAVNRIDDRPSPEGVVEIEPTLDRLVKTIAQLSEMQGDLLLVYWCGHGVLGTGDRRLLFTADATDADKYNLSVDDLLAFLASSRFTDAFRQQFLLFDACANFVDRLRWTNRVPHVELAAGAKREVGQLSYFSASQGQISKFDKTERLAVFSETAIGWLERNAASLPPDGDALVTEVNRVFDDLRAKGELRQRPVYRRYQYGPGQGISDDSGALPVSGAVQAKINARGLTVAQYQRIAESLRAVPFDVGDAAEVFAHDGRDALLNMLRYHARTDQDWIAVRRVEQCITRQYRISPVLERLGEVTRGQLSAAMHWAVPVRLDRMPHDLDEALDLAADYGIRRDGSAPLHRLVALLEYRTGRAVNDSWFNLPPGVLACLRDSAACVPEKTVGRLVIDLRPVGTAGTSWPDAVHGHLLLPGRAEWEPLDTFACERTEEAARGAVLALLDSVHDRWPALTFTVGLIVSRTGVDAHPENWCLVDDMAGQVPLWQEYPIFLHSAERMGNRRVRRHWMDKIAAIDKRLQAADPNLVWLERDEPSSLRLAVRGADACVFGLRFTPGTLGGELSKDLIIATLAGGAPYLVWPELEPDDWQAAQERLHSLAAEGSLADFPDRLFRLRTGDHAGFGASLRLIWDAPEVIPPTLLLSTPEENQR